MARRWSRVISRYPRVVLLLTSLLAVLSFVAAAARLEIRPSRAELLFGNERLVQLKQAYRRAFGDRDGVVIVVDASDLGRAKQFVSALAERLQGHREYIAELFYRADPAPFEAHALQYLSPAELEKLRRKIEDHEALIRDIATTPGVNTLFAGINREMGEALVGHFFTGFLEEKKSGRADLGLLNALLRQLDDALSGSGSFASPWGEWLGAGKEPVSEGYLLTEDKRYLVLLTKIRGTNEQTLVPKREAIQRIRTTVAEIGQTYPGIQAGVTGPDALASDEIVTAQRDSALATLVSFTISVALFFLLWRGFGVPLRAIVSVAVGICWALGFTTLAVGSLNILSAMFVPILIGLGVDYNIYVLERYAEERARGRNPFDALEGTFRTVGGPTMTGAFTTVVAFYSLTLTNFKGLVELGFITGSGLLLCLLSAFTVFPALVILRERRKGAWLTSRSGGFFVILERCSQRPWIVIAGAALLALASLPALGKIQFEFNLLELQAKGTESVDWELRLLEGKGTSTWYGIVLAKSPDEVRTKTARLKALPSVDRVQSIFSFLPKDPARKLGAIRALGTPLDKLPPSFGSLEPVDLEELGAVLERIRFKLGDKERFTSASDAELEEGRRLLGSLRGRLKTGEAAEVRQALAAYQTALFADFEKKIAILRRNLRAGPMTVADLPHELRDRFVGKEGIYLLRVLPQGNTWGREAVQRFVREVRSVDQDALGDPITAWEHGQSMEQGYLRGGLYAGIAMLVVVLWSFGSVSHLMLALVPLVVGVAWTLGLMELFHINFNLANLIFLPLIVGYGIINGLQIVKRYQWDGRTGSIIANSTGRAVFLSTATSMAGFGSLMVAHHRGIFSLGSLLAVGVGSVLLASLTVLPAVLWALSGVRNSRRGSLQLQQSGGEAERPHERSRVS